MARLTTIYHSWVIVTYEAHGASLGLPGQDALCTRGHIGHRGLERYGSCNLGWIIVTRWGAWVDMGQHCVKGSTFVRLPDISVLPFCPFGLVGHVPDLIDETLIFTAMEGFMMVKGH